MNIDFSKKISPDKMLNLPQGFKNTIKSKLDDSVIFGESSSEVSVGELIEIALEKLIPYSKNPFRLYEGERLEEMKRSISQYGILQPILVREIEGSDKFEILAGHNRYNVALLLSENDEKFKKIPVRVLKGIDDDTAELIVSESNMMQRSLNDLLPSEKAFVIATYYNAEKRQGKRNDLINKVNSILGKEDEDRTISGQAKAAIEFSLSPYSIAKYSKINTLAEKLKDNLNNGMFDLDTAYNLSFKTAEEQDIIYTYQQNKKIKINRKNSIEIKKLDEVSNENLDKIFIKPKSEKRVNIDKLVKSYFPKKDDKEIVEILEKLLSSYSSNIET